MNSLIIACALCIATVVVAELPSGGYSGGNSGFFGSNSDTIVGGLTTGGVSIGNSGISGGYNGGIVNFDQTTTGVVQGQNIVDQTVTNNYQQYQPSIQTQYTYPSQPQQSYGVTNTQFTSVQQQPQIQYGAATVPQFVQQQQYRPAIQYQPTISSAQVPVQTYQPDQVVSPVSVVQSTDYGVPSSTVYNRPLTTSSFPGTSFTSKVSSPSYRHQILSVEPSAEIASFTQTSVGSSGFGSSITTGSGYA